jgi:hypothetical protein
MASWRRRADGVPARLVSFRLTEWPDAKCPHEAIRQWQHACEDWLAEDSNRAPRPDMDEWGNRAWLAADSNRSLPFGEYGDCLDVMREALRLQHCYRGCPDEASPGTWTGREVRHV